MKFENFLKSRLIFNIFYCFSMFVNKVLCISRAHISKRSFNVISSTYCFHMKTKIWAGFQNCISVHLKVQSRKLCINKYMIVLAQITNTEIFAFRADPDPSWLQKKRKRRSLHILNILLICAGTRKYENY